MPSLHLDDHDAALRPISIFFLFFFPLLPLPFLFIFGLPTLVALRDLESRAILTASLLLFAATDLFDDPRLEHNENP